MTQTGKQFADTLRRIEENEEAAEELRFQLGSLLREWRTNEGISLQELADDLGMSKGRISDLERGAMTMTSVMAQRFRERMKQKRKS